MEQNDVYVDETLANAVVKGFLRKVKEKNSRQLSSIKKRHVAKLISDLRNGYVRKKKLEGHFVDLVTTLSSAGSVFVIKPPSKQSLYGVFADLIVEMNDFEEYITFRPTFVDYKSREILNSATSTLTARVAIRTTHVLSRMTERQNSLVLSHEIMSLMMGWYFNQEEIYKAHLGEASLVLPDGGYLLGSVEEFIENDEIVKVFVGKTYLPDKRVREKHKAVCVNSDTDYNVSKWNHFLKLTSECGWFRV